MLYIGFRSTLTGVTVDLRHADLRTQGLSHDLFGRGFSLRSCAGRERIAGDRRYARGVRCSASGVQPAGPHGASGVRRFAAQIGECGSTLAASGSGCAGALDFGLNSKKGGAGRAASATWIKCKGAPKKTSGRSPSWSAPLRATSSGICYANSLPFSNLLKIGRYLRRSPVGNALGRERFTPGRKTSPLRTRRLWKKNRRDYFVACARLS